MQLTQFLDNLHKLLGDLYFPIIIVIKILGILILSSIISKTGSFFIKKVFEKQKTFKYRIGGKRLDTMNTLLVSIFRYTVYIMALVTILTYLFDVKSVLAAAGVGGIVIGLGAQSLIKDIIAGFFIVLEDQFAIGDLITIDTMNGTVEEMGLRVTKLRNFNGDLYIIPNGEIKKVTNHTRGDKAIIVDVPLSYRADVNKAMEIANSVCENVSKEFNSIVEQPKVQGITEMGKESLTIRIVGKAVPSEYMDVERRIRKLINEEFIKLNVDFPDKNRMIVEEKVLKGGNESGR